MRATDLLNALAQNGLMLSAPKIRASAPAALLAKVALHAGAADAAGLAA